MNPRFSYFVYTRGSFTKAGLTVTLFMSILFTAPVFIVPFVVGWTIQPYFQICCFLLVIIEVNFLNYFLGVHILAHSFHSLKSKIHLLFLGVNLLIAPNLFSYSTFVNFYNFSSKIVGQRRQIFFLFMKNLGR